jgi:N6-L-threonylcarbamoyladenine synthase
MVLCLGIESTAHTFGASVISDTGLIKSDVRETYISPGGTGIHPREAAQHHAEIAGSVVARAISGAQVHVGDINCIAFSQGPGLGPCLRIGATIARAISTHYDIPIVPVNHAIGHIEIGTLTAGLRDPLTVLVSGGHTAILAFADGRWRVFGETEDITMGNVLDMFAREAGLPSPGGPNVESQARSGSNYVDLPYTVKGCDVSYSGLVTAAERKLTEVPLPDLCFSLQEVAFSMLAEVTERALAHTGKGEVLLTGGVAANTALQSKLQLVSREHDAKFGVVERKFSGDCGAQIAWTGVLAYRSGMRIPVNESVVKPRWRLDTVKIPWRD